MQRSILKKQVVAADNLINYTYFSPEAYKTALLILPGWRSDSSVWSSVMTNLNVEGLAAYAIDLPGFGQSQIPDRPYYLDDYVTIVDSFIHKLKLHDVVMLGHSFGGRIAIKFAAHNSVKGLILVDSAGIDERTFSKSLKTFIAKILHPIFKLSFLQALRVRIYKAIGSEDYVSTPHLRDTYLNVIGEDLRTEMVNIKAKTLLIWGENDQDTPLRWAEDMKSRITDASLLIVPGAGHFPFLDKPNDFLEILRSSLK